MNTDTALGLLGPLASIAVQRRYIVGGTKDTYRTVGELLDDGEYFLHHPQLGATQSLASVQEYARVLKEREREVPIDVSDDGEDRSDAPYPAGILGRGTVAHRGERRNDEVGIGYFRGDSGFLSHFGVILELSAFPRLEVSTHLL